MSKISRLAPARTALVRTALAPTALALLITLTACGGGSSNSRVVSLAGASSSGGSTASATSRASGEQQALDFINCLRKQGLDVPDPTVNADGTLSLAPPGGGATGGQPADRDPAIFQKAIAACGNPPASLTGGFNPDQPGFQDAALSFAKCMREKGYDVPDPDFSGGAPGPGGPGALFDQIDRNDPTTQADLRTCQKAFADAGITLPGQG
jgi:hypothetical protein